MMGTERLGTNWTGYALPLAMLVIGVLVAATIATMPQANLDVLMWRLWLPQIIPAAAPPVGVTGRTLLALLSLVPFVAAAALAWRLGARAAATVRKRVHAIQQAPTIRRADAHPDCPPRRPIRADEDLGPPLPIITVAPSRGVPELEQPLPADLEQRLAAFDPISIPDVPRDPIRAVPPLVTIVVPAREYDREAIEPIAELPIREYPAEAPAVEPVSEEPSEPVFPAAAEVAEVAQVSAPQPQQAEPAEPASLGALLDRLERGAKRHQSSPTPPSPPAPPVPAASLDDTLVMLRRMAQK